MHRGAVVTRASQPPEHFDHPADVVTRDGKLVVAKVATAARPHLATGSTTTVPRVNAKARVTQAPLTGDIVFVQFTGGDFHQ